jgi:DNA repair protein RadC
MRIYDIPKENRPRERLKLHGVDVLSDAELLVILIFQTVSGFLEIFIISKTSLQGFFS